MSNYLNNTFHGSTFQYNYIPSNLVPPPPLPPPEWFGVPLGSLAHTHLAKLDQDHVKLFENKIMPATAPRKPKISSITQVRNELRDLVLNLTELKNQEQVLMEKTHTCSDEEWEQAMAEVNNHKVIISNSLSNIKSSYLNILKKYIAKRSAKRLRLKRLKKEKKRAKEDRIKELEEKSRQIDENLQKIKDATSKAEQEQQSKLQADMVLKEVLRKKHNSKKFLSKLEALKKLRNAREGSARARGAAVSSHDAQQFDVKIDQLKLLWAQKLIVYEKEEEELRAKLDRDTSNEEGNEMEKQLASNLKRWRKVMFGSVAAPQVDFNGDVAKFVAVRRQWDQYAGGAGSCLPVGWVSPSTSR